MDQATKEIETYFLERPVSLSVALLLNEYRKGMTATDLAAELHMSVPTLYRLTNEMTQMGLLVGERKGRKIIFRITASLTQLLPTASKNVRKIQTTTPSKLERLSATKNLLEEFNLSLSPKVAEIMVVSALKQQISEKLPRGIRRRNVGSLKTILNEPVRFDLYLGTDDRFVAIELKIMETMRNLRERLGTMAMLTSNAPPGLVAIITAFLLTPIGGNWLVEEEMVNNAIKSLNTNKIKLIPVVAKVGRNEILDSSFLEDFASNILHKVKGVLKND